MPDNDKSLITDAAGLSAPLTKLVDAVSRGIGVLYEPVRVKRKAKADASARVILARADANASAIAQRAAQRLSHRELRRQHNIDRIITDTQRHLPATVSSEAVNSDWLARFFDCSQDIGDEEMQSLWAKLLAGELAQPKSFSMRTLEFVKTMDKEEAILFTRYCSFVLSDDDGFLFRLCLDGLDSYLAEKGVGPIARAHLADLGLIHSNDFSLTERDDGIRVAFIYNGSATRMLRPRPVKEVFAPLMMLESLTELGRELYPIAAATPDADYHKNLISSLIESGFTRI